jgi:hypothetical protein
VVRDPIVEGFFPWLIEAQKEFQVHVFSSRSNQKGGILAMMDYLHDEIRRLAKEASLSGGAVPSLHEWVDAVDMLYWPTVKPAAFLTIDDRGFTFQGVWPDVQRLKQFRPWNK